VDFSNILSHPNSEEIISRLVIGDDPKEIAQWLKIKYSEKEQKHLHLSAKVLQEYASKHLDLVGQLRQDLTIVKSGSDDKMQKQLSASLLNNKTYRQRVLELADTEIDIKKIVSELVMLCKDRMEQIFDRIQENPTHLKNDYLLVKYFETLFVAVEKYDKIHNNAPDQIIQHNITVQHIDQQVAMLQEAVRKTLAKMDSEASLIFMEYYIEELSKLQAEKLPSPVTVENRQADAKILSEITLPEIPLELEGT
jgi:hypothetical protein